VLPRVLFGDKWQARFFVAAQHYLRYYKDDTPGRHLLGAIDLRRVDVSEANGADFRLVMADSAMCLRAPDAEGAATWVLKLRELQLDDSISQSRRRLRGEKSPTASPDAAEKTKKAPASPGEAKTPEVAEPIKAASELGDLVAGAAASKGSLRAARAPSDAPVRAEITERTPFSVPPMPGRCRERGRGPRHRQKDVATQETTASEPASVCGSSTASTAATDATDASDASSRATRRASVRKGP